MRKYNPINLTLTSDKAKEFVVSNLIAISASITSMINQVNVNIKLISSNRVEIEKVKISSWTTANRPIKTVLQNEIGINTTTNKLNHTRDSGTTWYNADGTAA